MKEVWAMVFLMTGYWGGSCEFTDDDEGDGAGEEEDGGNQGEMELGDLEYAVGEEDGHGDSMGDKEACECAGCGAALPKDPDAK